LAARTQRIRLGTGIVNVFSRTPALLGQTAATLDLISGGRFILGLGTSGHQVISGWHGMAFDRPLVRMRETIAIVRQVLRRDRLIFDGEVFRLDKGLKLLARPVRETVPIYLATLTPGGLRLTGELADGWIPTLFSPGHMDLIRHVPDALVDAISIAGPPAYVRERLALWASAGVTTMLASVHGKTQAERLRTLEMLATAAGAVD